MRSPTLPLALDAGVDVLDGREEGLVGDIECMVAYYTVDVTSFDLSRLAIRRPYSTAKTVWSQSFRGLPTAT